METEEGRYIGSVIDGKLTGDGIMFFKNGDKYDGYWLEGAFHGKGKLSYANGDTFSGEFKYGKRSGRGMHIRLADRTRDPLADGQWVYMYEGDYVDDIRWGYGVLKEVRDPSDVEGERYIEYFG